MEKHEDRLTLAEMKELYFTRGVFEYLDGKEAPFLNVTMRQQFIARRFANLLRQHVKDDSQVSSHGVWPFAIVDEDDFVIASLAPNLTFYSNETWETYLQNRSTSYIEKPLLLVPEMVIEIITDDDGYSDTMRQVDFYLENGVLLVWLFDITRKVVVEHSYLYPEGHTFRRDMIVSGGEIVPDLEFMVSDVFDVEDEMPNLTYDEVVKLAKAEVSKYPSLKFRTVVYVDETKTPYWHVWFDDIDRNGKIVQMDPSSIYVRIIDATSEVSIPTQF